MWNVAGGTGAFAAEHQAEVGFSFSDVNEFNMLLDPYSGYVHAKTRSFSSSFAEGHWQLIDTTTSEAPYADGTPITCSLFFDTGWAISANCSYALDRDWRIDVDLTELEEAEEEEFTEDPFGRFRVRNTPGAGALIIWRFDEELEQWDTEMEWLSGATGSIHEEYQFTVEIVDQGIRFMSPGFVENPINTQGRQYAYAHYWVGDLWKFSGGPQGFAAGILAETSLQVTAADID